MILNSPYISGSLTVTGNIITSGSITISGSIASASYASNADLLDGLDSTVFTLTSSFAAQTASFTAFTASLNAFSASILAQTASLNSFSASILTFTGSAATRLGALESYTSSLNAKTASFATTGSNTFVGTQTITGSVLQSGSFTSTGTLTAQTLVVQTITSSVVYSSGSNIFGNTIGNTQTFTGSVLVTGSLTISTGGNASAPIIFGSTIACSPIGCFATSCATSFIGGTMSGTTIYGSTAVCSPVGKFTSCIDAGSGTFSGALGGTSATLSGLLTITSGAGTKAVWATTRNFGVNRNFQIAVDEFAESAFTITPSTTLGGSGYTTPIFTLAAAGAATFSSTITGTTIYGSTAVCSPVGKFTSCIDAGYLSSVINSSSNASPLILQNTAGWGSSQISSISVKDGSGVVGAIGWKYDGVGNVDMLFHSLYCGGYKTTTDVVMTVKGTGNVGIGISSPSSILDVQSAASIIKLKSTTGTNSVYTNYENCSNFYVGTDSAAGGSFGKACAAVLWQVSCNSIVFATSNTEQMRITGGGNVGIGTNTPNEKLDVNGVVQVRGSSLGYATTQCVGMLDFYASATRLLSFGGDATTCGCFRFYSAGQNNNGGSDVAIISGGGVACFKGTVCAPTFRASNRLISNFTQIYNSDFTVSTSTSRSVVICGGILTTGDFHLMMYGNAGTGMGSIRFSTYGYFANSSLLGFCEHLRSTFGSAAISSVSNNGTSISFTIANCSVSNVISGNWRMISTVGDDANQCLNVFVL